MYVEYYIEMPGPTPVVVNHYNLQDKIVKIDCMKNFSRVNLPL